MFIYKHDLFIVIITICDYILPLYLDINSNWFAMLFDSLLIICMAIKYTTLDLPPKLIHSLNVDHLSFITCVCACVLTRSCLTLCDSMNCSIPGSSLHAIFQARILEQVAISYSRSHHNMVLYSSLSLMTTL